MRIIKRVGCERESAGGGFLSVFGVGGVFLVLVGNRKKELLGRDVVIEVLKNVLLSEVKGKIFA